MTRRTVDQDAIALFAEFTHGTMSRRTFMERLAGLAGGAAAAAALVLEEIPRRLTLHRDVLAAMELTAESR